MEYYFKVIFDVPHGWCYLVKAKDVVTAGLLAKARFHNICGEAHPCPEIVEITRTDIDYVIT